MNFNLFSNVQFVDLTEKKEVIQQRVVVHEYTKDEYADLMIRVEQVAVTYEQVSITHDIHNPKHRLIEISNVKPKKVKGAKRPKVRANNPSVKLRRIRKLIKTGEIQAKITKKNSTLKTVKTKRKNV